jgi:hypothetical protein
MLPGRFDHESPISSSPLVGRACRTVHRQRLRRRRRPIVSAEHVTDYQLRGRRRGLQHHRQVDLTGPFFQSLGTNGRACVSCHQPSVGWTITPENVQARFDATGGTDPIFRTNDGSNSPSADVSTPEARRAAYSMLLSKGLIRIGIGIPSNAEFELMSVDDPYEPCQRSRAVAVPTPLPRPTSCS